MPQKGLTSLAKEVEQSPQHKALSSLPTASAINDFCGSVEKTAASKDEGSLEEALISGWQVIIAKAASTPYNDPSSQQLADAVLSIKLNRPDFQVDGQTVEVQGQKLWQDLPLFGMQMREAWNLSADDRSSQEQKDEWINLTAFTSHIVQQAHSKTKDQPDFSLFCIWTVRQALEEENTFDVSVAAAAVWFKLAASTILDFCKQEKSFDGKLAKGGFSYKDKGWTGFSVERWQVWQQRLNELQAKVADNTTKQLVSDALKAIENAS